MTNASVVAKKVHRLGEGKGLVTRKTELVVEFELSSGLVLVVWSRILGIGGVLHFQSGERAISARLERLVRQLRSESGAGLSVDLRVEAKVFSMDRELCLAIKRELQPAGIRLRGEVEDIGQGPGEGIRTGRAVPVEGRLLLRKSAVDPVARAAPRARTRVLIVDDSKSMRLVLRHVIAQDHELELVGEAASAEEADRLIPRTKPDVLTLDIHMPKEDGVSFLRRLMKRSPMPVVVLTSLNIEDSEKVFEALSLGAVDCVQKPSLERLSELGPMMREKLKVAARDSRLQFTQEPPPVASRGGQSSSSWIVTAPYKAELIAIGASTGGIQTLEGILHELPSEIPPILVVQHIPPRFSEAFARRLDASCPFEVKEAEHGDAVRPNRVLIAPGGLQMALVRRQDGLQVEVYDGPRESLHKPSVDILFSSVAREIGAKAVGAILTGMGADGAKGLLEMRRRGAVTFAQSKESCIVFGMPRVAIELGAAMRVVHRRSLPTEIIKAAQSLV